MDTASQAGESERKKKRAVTEYGLKEMLNKLLPAVLHEMGILPANKAGEKGKTAAAATKGTPFSEEGLAAAFLLAVIPILPWAVVLAWRVLFFTAAWA